MEAYLKTKHIVCIIAALITVIATCLCAPLAFADTTTNSNDGGSGQSDDAQEQADKQAAPVEGEKLVTRLDATSTIQLVIDNTMDGDTFKATRVVISDYTGTALERKFASGFSYGTNADTRDDNGLGTYLELTDASAIKNAVSQFEKQVQDSSESYTSTSEGGHAVFDALPLGQYIVQGTSADGSRTYETMLANIEPSVENQSYVLTPVAITAKYTDVVNPPHLTIDKDSDAGPNADPNKPIHYKVVANQDVKFGTAHNVHISDKLSDEAASAGMKLNHDVIVRDGNGKVIDGATVTYNSDSTGFQVDLPDPMGYNESVTLEYTGDASKMTRAVAIQNTAKVWSDECAEVADDLIVNIDKDKLQQTGDTRPYLYGALAVGAAAIIIGIAAHSRRKRQD